jgi:hypothetical protein
LGDDVPPELAPVLDAAVALDPDDRPASASELARLLRAAVPADAVRLPGPASLVHRVPGRPTRVFGPRPPVPVVRARRRPKGALALLLLAPLAGLWFRPGAPPPRDCEPVRGLPGAQIVRADTSGAGCLSVGVYKDQILTIRVRPDDATPRRFALGLPGDVLTLGDPDCDGVATPALYRASTGETLYYDTWDSNDRPSSTLPTCQVR